MKITHTYPNDFSPLLTEAQISNISLVPEFSTNTYYNHLDIGKVFNYWDKRYIKPMQEYTSIDGKTLVDAGAGFGWLSFVFLLRNGGHAVIVEPNTSKLIAAKKIANILGVSDRCTFYSCYIDNIPMESNSADFFVSVETIEHVGRSKIVSSFDTIEKITKEMILITTPNKFFPVDSHDTRLPFIHWFPKKLRPFIACFFGYHREFFNDYAGPWHLTRLMKDFKPVSRVLMFSSMEAWEASYPFLSPYKKGIYKEAPKIHERLLLRCTSSLLGRYSFMINPNLCSVWLRRDAQ